MKSCVCSNLDGPRDYHTKWNVRKKKTNTIWYQLYAESKIWHELIYETGTDPQTENNLLKGKEGGVGIN